MAAISDLNALLHPAVLVFLIPIAAILVGGAVAITKLWIRHRERLAMIQAGMHPDLPPRDDAGGKATGPGGAPR